MDKSQFEFCALLENQTEGTKNSKCVKFWFLHVDLEFSALKVCWNVNSLPCCTNPHNLGAQAICIWSCYVLVESLQLVVQLFPFLLFRSAQETLLCKMGNLQKMQQKFNLNAVKKTVSKHFKPELTLIYFNKDHEQTANSKHSSPQN